MRSWRDDRTGVLWRQAGWRSGRLLAARLSADSHPQFSKRRLRLPEVCCAGLSRLARLRALRSSRT
ncbi:MAG: hypothetical protein ACI9U2_003707 [Bradymonadia bacterium]|jgi:hypothetical protein